MDENPKSFPTSSLQLFEKVFPLNYTGGIQDIHNIHKQKKDFTL